MSSLRDSFEVDLRTAMQAQAEMLRRIGRTTDKVERDFADSRVPQGEIHEMQAILDELEAGSEFLDADDLVDFDPDDIPRLYERRRAEVSSELTRIDYRNWDDFVRKTRVFAVSEGLDPLAPFDTMLADKDFEQLKSESYEASLRWDKTDYLFVFGSGILAALTDLLLVRVPKTMGQSSEYVSQKGSPLTEWIKKENTNKGKSDGWFAKWARELEEKCKVPYDRQHAIFDEELEKVPGMGGRTHRVQSLGHDPVLGFVFGVLDILRGTITGFSYDKHTGDHEFFSQPTGAAIFDPSVDKNFTVRLIEAILKSIGHLISDVATPDGLPAPFMTLVQGINVGSFGEKGRSVGEIARWMYTQGYDFRHFLVSGITPFVIEITLRAYLMLRHFSEHGETKFMVAQNPKYRSMLLTAHSVAAAANAGKVALYQGNPLAVNQAEWMAFMRYLLPHMKYWMFDRSRMKLEHMEKINEAGWNDLLFSSDQLLNQVVEKEWNVIDLGRYRDTSPS